MMRGLVVGGMLAATMLPGTAGAQLDEAERREILIYAAEAGMVMDMVAGTFNDLVPLGQQLASDITNRDALNALIAETGVFEAAYDAALEIEAPPLVMDAHVELMDGLELLAEAAPLMRDGFEDVDLVSLNEATELLAEANGHIQEATELLAEATTEIR